MIVSASTRSDIPAFYGRWFEARLDAGFARTANPFGGQPYIVDLRREAVDGFVFWTRNIAPFVPVLRKVWSRGMPFMVQHTVLGYPRALDRFVPDPAKTVAALRAVAAEFGPEVAVWRYDPVVFSSVTPPAWHLGNFRRLAAALQGATNEVVLSVVHPYRKTRANLDAAAQRDGFAWFDPADEEKRALLAALCEIAADHGLRPTLCAQPHLANPHAGAARCIDARRLERVSQRLAGGPKVIEAPVRGTRQDCLCFAARDIGAYESCAHGCVYCYAVQSHDRAVAVRRAHDSAAESLVPGQAAHAAHTKV